MSQQPGLLDSIIAKVTTTTYKIAKVTPPAAPPVEPSGVRDREVLDIARARAVASAAAAALTVETERKRQRNREKRTSKGRASRERHHIYAPLANSSKLKQAHAARLAAEERCAALHAAQRTISASHARECESLLAEVRRGPALMAELGAVRAELTRAQASAASPHPSPARTKLNQAVALRAHEVCAIAREKAAAVTARAEAHELYGATLLLSQLESGEM